MVKIIWTWSTFNGNSDKKPWFETTNHNWRRGGWKHVAGREGEEVGYNAQTEDNCHFYQTARLNGLPRINTVFLVETWKFCHCPSTTSLLLCDPSKNFRSVLRLKPNHFILSVNFRLSE